MGLVMQNLSINGRRSISLDYEVYIERECWRPPPCLFAPGGFHLDYYATDEPQSSSPFQLALLEGLKKG